LKIRTVLLISTASLVVFLTLTDSSSLQYPVRRGAERATGLPVKADSQRPLRFFAPLPEINKPRNSLAMSSPVPAELPGKALHQIELADTATNGGGGEVAGHWQNWQTALLTGDISQIPIEGGLLAEHLRQTPDAAIYQEITTLLNDPVRSVAEKNLLVGLLGEIATQDALTELMNLAQEGNQSPLYLASLQAISQVASNRWGGRFHEELSPTLELAWQDMQGSDPAYAATLAKSIASIGAPAGVNALLDALTDPSRQINVDDKLRLKQKAAFAVLPDVRNPAAIETLTQHITTDSMETPGFEVSGLALASMGVPEATEQLLNWSQTAPASAASRVEDWFSKVQDSASVDLLLARQPSLNFQDPAVESAFERTLDYLNPPLEELTTPVPQYDGVNGGVNTPLISPFADSINSGLNNAIFAEPAASGGADFNALEQALQTDPVQAHPRRRRGRKPAR